MDPTDRDQLTNNGEEIPVRGSRKLDSLQELGKILRECGYVAKAMAERQNLQRSDAERKSVEAALRVQIEELGKQLVEKEKLEAILRRNIQELEKNLQQNKDQLKEYKESNCKSYGLIATQCRQLNEKKRECADAAETIKELQKKLQERDGDKEQSETTVRGQIERENKVREKDSDMATSDCYREKMEANLQDTNNDKTEVVSALRGNMKLVAVTVTVAVGAMVAGW